MLTMNNKKNQDTNWMNYSYYIQESRWTFLFLLRMHHSMSSEEADGVQSYSHWFYASVE